MIFLRLRKNKTLYLILLFLCILFPRVCYQDEIHIFNDPDSDKIKNPEISQSDIHIDSYLVPSVAESISSNQIIKIGLLDDLNHFSGNHAWKGALLAAREVNEEGGILINGSSYYVGLVAENTNETAYIAAPASEQIEAAERIINDHHPHFITGGWAHPPLPNYLEVVMDNKIPFLGTGSGFGSLCQNVINDYERYKYFFRISPTNFSSIWTDIFSYILYLCSYLNSIDAGIVNKTAILRDPNLMFDAFAESFKFYYPTVGISVEEDIIFPFNATAIDFINYWSQIESKGVQVVNLMTLHTELTKLIFQTYQQVQPQCLIVSWSDLGKLNTAWDYVEGALQFGIVLQSIYNTSKTPLTIPFFTRYVNEYDIEPAYTGTGSYDAVKLLVQTVNETQTFDPDITVSALEKHSSTNPYTGGAGGYSAFTPSHDLKYGYPFGYGLFCQWKYIDGTKEVVPNTPGPPRPPGWGYPDSIATGSLRLPYWGINGLLTDPPQPPGNFTMSGTAETPDLDGKFNLTWTNSEGADNYSIHMSNNPITYISKTFDLLAYQTASPPFRMSLKKGDYYFRVVAYNETGERMSSNYIHVNIPGPGPFDLSHNADEPDTDGNFDLAWTESERADNYSVYRHKSKITSINESAILLANQTTQLSFSVTELSNGKYYIAVAAYNEMGYTLSNWVYIKVQLPFDMTIILIVLISSAVGLVSIPLVRRYLKHKAKIKAERERREPIIVEDMTREPLERPKTGEKNKVDEKKK
jgi:branched-chain amino acid transport system substrate-binding protein